MPKYEVVVSVYEVGNEDPLAEAVILETGDYDTAVEEFETAAGVDIDDCIPDEADEEETTEEPK